MRPYFSTLVLVRVISFVSYFVACYLTNTMSLDKQELQALLQKVREADVEQARTIQAELGAYEAADRIFEQIERNTEQHCPTCHEQDRVIKYGKDRDGQQRLKCKGCDTTFVEHHHKPQFNSEFSDETWRAFLTSMIGGATLNELAEKYNLNIKTAFRWRHRLLRHIRELQKQEWLAGRVWADETNLRKNLPGRGRDGATGQLAILTAKDYKDRTFIVPTNDGHMARAKDIEQTFENYLLPQSSTLVTDGARNLSSFCDRNDVEQDVCDSKSEDMRMINWLHSKFKNWYRQFRGVSVKYAANYCAWFSFLENNPNLRPLAT